MRTYTPRPSSVHSNDGFSRASPLGSRIAKRDSKVFLSGADEKRRSSVTSLAPAGVRSAQKRTFDERSERGFVLSVSAVAASFVPTGSESFEKSKRYSFAASQLSAGSNVRSVLESQRQVPRTAGVMTTPSLLKREPIGRRQASYQSSPYCFLQTSSSGWKLK